MMLPGRIAAIGLILLAAACASGAGSGVSEVRRDRNLISSEELAQASEAETVFDAIRRLRPAWLRGRGTSDVRVFINGVDMGRANLLRDYQVGQIRECRFISPTDASMRFGIGFGGGVIDVITR
jgi:hypothetical protein